MLLFPQQVQKFPQLQPQLLLQLQLQLQGLQELPQELQQLFPLPPQHPSRMIIRIIHRQLPPKPLLLPQYMICFTSLALTALYYEGRDPLVTVKQLFFTMG